MSEFHQGSLISQSAFFMGPIAASNRKANKMLSFTEDLWKLCEEDIVHPHYIKQVSQQELCEEERQKLLTSPPNEYQVFRYEAASINNYGYFSANKNKYGITPELCGKTVYVKTFYDAVKIHYEHAPNLWAKLWRE